MKPIRVYLDTSDYIQMLSAPAGSKAIQVKEEIQSYVDHGLVEIGYSYWVVTELIKDGDSTHSEDRRRKGELLKSLACGNSFPHPIDLKAGSKFPNDGIWVPRAAFKDFNEAFILNAFKEAVRKEARLNRSFRRKLSTKSGLQELAKQFGINLDPRDFPFPVSNEFIQGRYFERYLKGEVSAQVLIKALTEWFSDPSKYYDIYFQYARKDDPIEALLCKAEESFVEFFRKLAEGKEVLERSQREAKGARKKYYELLRNSDLPDEIKKALPKLESLPKFDLFAAIDVQSQLEEFFPAGQAGYFEDYIREILNGRVFKRSDVIDLLHMQYVYCCDLFRCDRENFILFSKSNHLPVDRLVRRLGDLPQRINDLARQRGLI